MLSEQQDATTCFGFVSMVPLAAFKPCFVAFCCSSSLTGKPRSVARAAILWSLSTCYLTAFGVFRRPLGSGPRGPKGSKALERDKACVKSAFTYSRARQCMAQKKRKRKN